MTNTAHRAIINNETGLCLTECYLADREEFLTSILALYQNAVVLKSLTTCTKVNVILILMASLEYDFIQKIHAFIDLPDMERACRVLDSGRAGRQLERRLTKTTKTKKLKKIKGTLSNLKELSQEHSILPLKATLTRCRRQAVMAWTKSISPENLQYRAYLFKTNLWRDLADMCHLKPSRDFQLDWFLGYCFGDSAPEGSLVRVLNEITTDNFQELYKAYEIPYECIHQVLKTRGPREVKFDASGWEVRERRVRAPCGVWKKSGSESDGSKSKDKFYLTPESKALIIQRESLKTILWNWKELSCPLGENIFAARLSTAPRAELEQLTYGKLLDAVLKSFSDVLCDSLISVADRKLSGYTCNIEQPVAVLCDASSSMGVAISTSSIITSMLSVVATAELQVFRKNNQTIEQPPTSVREAVAFAKTIEAYGSTSPASSLDYYYQRKKVIKTFIVVTDEEENTPAGNGRRSGWGQGGRLQTQGFFAELYSRYINEVYPAKLVFISFSKSNIDAAMVSALKEVLPSASHELITVHKIDVRNPDMNRLDYVMEQMSAGASHSAQKNQPLNPRGGLKEAI